MTHAGTITHGWDNKQKNKSNLGTKWEGHKVLKEMLANKMANQNVFNPIVFLRVL